MNKAELIEAVQKLMGKEATKRAAEEAVSNVLESIATGIKKSKKVQLIFLMLSLAKFQYLM